MDKIKAGTALCGIICAALGAAVAFMLLFLGFWRTVFIVALTAIGYFIGSTADKGEALKNGINRVFPPKGE